MKELTHRVARRGAANIKNAVMAKASENPQAAKRILADLSVAERGNSVTFSFSRAYANYLRNQETQLADAEAKDETATPWAKGARANLATATSMKPPHFLDAGIQKTLKEVPKLANQTVKTFVGK